MAPTSCSLWTRSRRSSASRKNVFIVFTATAFSLLGLRQLYFLIDGLLDRLIYLSYGLAAILGFIGVKLILHALHENNVAFINDGQPVNVVEISTGLSLSVILGVLAVTVVASLFSRKGKAQTAIANAGGLTRSTREARQNGNASSACSCRSVIRFCRLARSIGRWSATSRPSWSCSSAQPPSTTRQLIVVKLSRSPARD